MNPNEFDILSLVECGVNIRQQQTIAYLDYAENSGVDSIRDFDRKFEIGLLDGQLSMISECLNHLNSSWQEIAGFLLMRSAEIREQYNATRNAYETNGELEAIEELAYRYEFGFVSGQQTVIAQLFDNQLTNRNKNTNGAN